MAAGPRDLTTLAKLKTWVNVAGASDDTMLQDLITNVSAWIEQWLSRSFFIPASAKVEVRDGNGGTKLLLSDFPVVDVSAVSINGTQIPESTSTSVNGFFFTDILVGLRGYVFTRGDQNISITYTSGLAQLSHPEQVPAEIQQCCLELCALRYKERDFVGIENKNLGGETVTFSQRDMPKSVATLLENYKRRIPL